MTLKRSITTVLIVVLAGAAMTAHAGGASRVADFEWDLLTDDPGWAPRAGLQAVDLRNTIYIMGGRTPLDPAFNPFPGASTFYSDVWASSDQGRTWSEVLPSGSTEVWEPRGYFQAVTMGGRMFVLGGQDFNMIPNPDPNGPPFLPVSQFFNDVWSSKDGVTWELLTAEAPWHGRAGLSAAVLDGEIYVMGGSFNDDPAIIGGPPVRIYFNDVWKSADGVTWELASEAAPWAPRAGGIAVTKGAWLYMVGGEDGFTCIPGGRCPPYYNDVWRTQDGANWELVTAEADWSSRPGHQCVVLNNQFVLFGGFGLSPDPTNPFLPSNPMDVWVSTDGAAWTQVSDSPWNAAGPEDIKYDFDALVAVGGGGPPAIFTFGGDRETFNFADPENHLRVDDDVWRFGMPSRGRSDKGMNVSAVVRDLRAAPNPFNPQVAIMFTLERPERVSLAVYDLSGRLVRTLHEGSDLSAGDHQVFWNGRDQAGRAAPTGVYFYRVRAGDFDETRRVLMVK
jgi:hypothetical protein